MPRFQRTGPVKIGTDIFNARGLQKAHGEIDLKDGLNLIQNN